MKQTLLTICFLFITGSIFGLTLPGQIFYEDDTVDVIFSIPIQLLSGQPNFVRIQDRIKYRIEGEKKRRKLFAADAEEIRFKHLGSTLRMLSIFYPQQRFELFGRHQDFKQFVLLREDGKVRLFEYFYQTAGTPMMNGNGTMTGGGNQTHRDFYLERNGAYVLVKRGGFKNNIANFFRDCDELSEKIANKTLRYRDLNYIVTTYNQGCGSNMKG
ncbi:MAG: hypothetical protein AB8F95_02050 [Bacteroidia bacterium]